MEKKKDTGSAVKIDSLLLSQIDEFIKKDQNRLRFANKKQFINIAVYELLNKYKHES